MGLKELMKLKLQLSIFAISCGTSILDGYGIACLFAIRPYLRKWLNYEPSSGERRYDLLEILLQTTNDKLIELAQVIGSVIGCLMIPKISVTYGRKGGILLMSFITIFSILLSNYSKVLNMPILFLMSRLLLSMKLSVATALASMYLMEIMPRNYNGALCTIHIFYNMLGAMIGNSLPDVLNPALYWTVLLNMVVVLCILQIWLLPLIPESPKYLYVIKKKFLESEKATKWLRGKAMSVEEIEELDYELIQRKKLGTLKIAEFDQNDILLRAILITSIVMCSPVLCGVQVLTEYLKLLSGNDSDLLTKVMTVSLVISSIIGLFIIDNISRRVLILACTTILSICCFVVFVIQEAQITELHTYIYCALIFMYISSWRMGCCTTFYFVVCEYFNTANVPLAYSIGSTLYWGVKFFEYLTSTRMKKFLENYAFFTYSIFNFLITTILYYILVDSRNVPLKIVYKRIYESIMKRK